MKNKETVYKKTICPECHGSGEVSRGFDGCYKCTGTGYIFVEKKKKAKNNKTLKYLREES